MTKITVLFYYYINIIIIIIFIILLLPFIEYYNIKCYFNFYIYQFTKLLWIYNFMLPSQDLVSDYDVRLCYMIFL